MPVQPYIPYALHNYTPVLRSMPAPTVSAYNQEPVVCIEVSEELISYIIGLLEIYRWRDKFQGSEQDVERALGVFNDLMAALAEASECMAIKNIRVQDCLLQVSYDAQNWVTVGNLSDCAVEGPRGPQGPAGPAGPQGPAGLTPFLRARDCSIQASYDAQNWVTLLSADSLRSCVGNSPEPSAQASGRSGVCSGAYSVLEFIDQTLDVTLSGLDVSASALQLAGQVSGGFITRAALIVDVFTSILGTLTSMGTGLIRSQRTPSASDKLLCDIYCAVPGDNKLTASALQQEFAVWRTDSNLYIQAMGMTAQAIPVEELLARFTLGAANTDNRCQSLCACGVQCGSYDFENGDHGWLVSWPNEGIWTGSSFAHNPNNPSRVNCGRQFSPPLASLRRVVVHLSAPLVGSWPSMGVRVNNTWYEGDFAGQQMLIMSIPSVQADRVDVDVRSNVNLNGTPAVPDIVRIELICD